MRICCFLLLSMLGIASESFASTGNGNAGDDKLHDHDATWFLGELKTVRACIGAAPSFGEPDESLRALVNDAFGAWVAYARDKRLFRAGDAQIPRPSRTLVIEERCTGEQDLAFYFGTTSSEIEDARKLYVNPVAFAYRQTHDVRTGWSKGFIWVAPPGRDGEFPNWKRPGTLFGILLHELGHVMGSQHVSGTIMGEDISAKLKEPRTARRLLHIDDTRELVVCRACAVVSPGHLGRDRSVAANNFELLTGRRTVAHVQASLKLSASASSLTVQVEGEDTAVELALDIDPGEIRIEGDTKVFFRALSNDTHRTAAYKAPMALVQTGTITTATGQRLRVSLQRNASAERGPFLITYLGAGGIQMSLFESGELY